MIPILFDANEKDFSTRGLGALSDAKSCKVVEERNGTYELTMQYPKDGIHFNDIGLNKIISAIPSPYREAQPFRIYKISTPMNGVVTINAQHISYDLSGITVMPFTANSVADVLSKIKINSVNTNEFEFTGNSTATSNCVYSVPYTARQILGGVEGSIIDRFHGEYEFDKFTVRWYENRGSNNGVTVRYGKNLLTLNQEVDVSKIVTGVIPYWTNPESGDSVVGDRIEMEGEYAFTIIKPLDLSDKFEEAPTKDQLNQRAKSYIKANYSVEPDINCTVSFALVEQYDEYKDYKLLEQCDLCDIVTVQYPDLGVNSTAKIVKIDTDVLKGRYNSVTIGSVRANIAQTIIDQQKSVENVPTKVSVSQMVHDSLDKITGAQGGSVRLLDTNGDGSPDTLYIADDPDPMKAKKVWRFNYLGWAASSNGYNGPFTLGATLEDGLLADFVKAANLVAGTIKSADDGRTSFLDLDSGVLRMNATQFSINSSSIDDYVDDAVSGATSGFESRLSKAESTLQVHDGQISAKASQSSLDALSGRVTTAESRITTQAGQISAKASQSSVDSLGNRLSTAESSISANARAIESRVTESEVDSVVQSSIIQNANSIRLLANEIEWKSNTSSMSKDGVFTSVNTWDDPNWFVIENGELWGGQGDVDIGWAWSLIDLSAQKDGYAGVTISAFGDHNTNYEGMICLDCQHLFVGNSETGYGEGYNGFVQFVDDIVYKPNRNEYTWTHKTFIIVNGIITDVYVS